MIKGFETVNKIYLKSSDKNILSTSLVKTKDTQNQKREKQLTSGLVGLSALAVIGFSGIKLFRSKSLNAKDINTSIIDFKKFFSEIKQIPSFIFSPHENYKLINNPEAEKCLEVLENLTPKAKKAFVRDYCSFTGFPKLEEVTKNIDKEILSSLNKMVEKGNNKALFAGYDSNCSAARNLAFPGSDCDGLFVIVEKPVYEFSPRVELGLNMNQRLIDSTGMHFPEVFCLDDIKHAIYKAEDIVQNRLNLTSEKLKRYENNLSYDGKDFVKAAEFNIDIANQLSDKYEKEIICLTAFFAEFLRSGKVLLNNVDKGFLDYVKNTKFYKFSNVTRQEAFHGALKPKLEARKKLCKEFENMSNEEKFAVCKDLFKSSLGLKSETQKDCFEDFDMGNLWDMYKKLRE